MNPISLLLSLFLSVPLFSFQLYSFSNYQHKYPDFVANKKISVSYITDTTDNYNCADNFNKFLDNLKISSRPINNLDGHHDRIVSFDTIGSCKKRLIKSEITTLLNDARDIPVPSLLQKVENHCRLHENHKISKNKDNNVRKSNRMNLKNKLLKPSNHAPLICILSFLLILRYIVKVLFIGLKMMSTLVILGYVVVIINKILRPSGTHAED